MGLFVLYFTTERVYRDIEHHTIVFGETFREILTEIFDQHRIPDDLSLYLHRPGATDPSMAPKNGVNPPRSPSVTASRSAPGMGTPSC
jgi:phytoene desaturase